MSFEIDPDAGTLAGDGGPRAIPELVAHPGLLVEVASDGFVGTIVTCSQGQVVLQDRRGRQRRFARSPGAFLVEGRRVTLVPPQRPDAPQPTAPASTNSGSVPVAGPARVARAGRLLVEGIHDAELIEHVWGDDLRAEGVVVEVLHGADDLGQVVRACGPGPGRRLGILLDHLVEGTKESHIAREADHPHVLVTGHPYVDIWAAVRPELVGIDRWPDIPRPRAWKEGVAAHLGYGDVHEAWRHIRSKVRTWRDLDRTLIGAVEQLIDFVTDDVR